MRNPEAFRLVRHCRRSGAASIGSRSGFTLIEVILALALVGLAVTIVLQLLSSNLRSLSTSENYVRAGIRAESRMREIVDDGHLAEGRWTESTQDGYRIDVAVSPVRVERSRALAMKLFRVDLTLAWREGAGSRSITLSTLKLLTPSGVQTEAEAS